MAFERRGGRWTGLLAMLAAANLAAQTVPGQLGVSDRDAQEQFLRSVLSGYPQLGTAGTAFVALPPTTRATVVQGGFAWARTYVKSPAFRTAYANARQEAKPTPPDVQGTVDEEARRQLDQQLADLAESRKGLAQFPPEQRKAMEAVFKQTEEQLRDPQYLELLRSGIAADRAGAQESYRNDMSQWEEAYPANPDVLVRRRLQAFLTACGDVDFSAVVQPRDRLLRFVNPDYELKSAEWKTCYRAGPEAVGAARTAATAWLKELPAQ